MRWKRGTSGAGQIEDRRGQGGSGRGGMGFPIGGRAMGGGLGGIVLLLLLALGGNLIGGDSGFDVGPSLDSFEGSPGSGRGTLEGAPDPDAELKDFVTFVVDNVQDSWSRQFAQANREYKATKLVLFDDVTPTGCGTGEAASGPFYCPADGQVYLDLGFFRELRDKFGAPGDFAQAYVIAHEFGHHVQNLLGIDDDVRRQQSRSRDRSNELSVRMELQADCMAGVWGYSAYREDLLESGDLEEGLQAAAAVGDDRIQRQAGARVNPESWTHGSSKQRARWFTRGFESGRVEDCDAFSGEI
ncbi:MAG TPA: neutral zinc metallopeptidase [Actinomycetota bacterium]|nr:neutral zinc metallopeptidase [Actinomycetota bacterium]